MFQPSGPNFLLSCTAVCRKAVAYSIGFHCWRLIMSSWSWNEKQNFLRLKVSRISYKASFSRDKTALALGFIWTAKKYFFRLCSLCLTNLYSNDLASFQGCIVKFKGVIQKWHHTTRGSGKPLKISHSVQMFFNKLKAILSSPWRKMVIIITTKWHCEFIIHFWVSLLLNCTYSKTLNPCVTY